jgi:hypothetical protein
VCSQPRGLPSVACKVTMSCGMASQSKEVKQQSS